MKKYYWSLLVLYLFLPSICLADNSISLGGIQIHIGDSKQKFLSQFADIRCGEILCMVYDRSNNNLGSIQFVNDKIAVINKDWGQYSLKEGLRIVQGIIGAISSLPDDEKVAQVSSYRVHQPDVISEGISMSFKNRTIDICRE